MVWTLPRANHGLQQLRIDIVTGTSSKQIEPRVFYEDWQGMVLYVFEARAEDEGLWRGVFVAEDLIALSRAHDSPPSVRGMRASSSKRARLRGR